MKGLPLPQMRQLLAVASSRRLLGAIACLVTIGISYSIPTFAQIRQPVNFNPPAPTDSDRPTKRKDAGSSGPCETASTAEYLTALVPKLDTQAKTVEANPTLWFYIPYQSFHSMEFLLSNARGEIVYQTQLTPPTSLPGVVSVSLPAGKVSLDLNQKYTWQFLIFCQDPQLNAGGNVDFFVKGAIERIAPSAELQRELTSVTGLRDRAAIYAKHGIWHDALTPLANLRRQDAGTTTADWADLLEDVDLKEVVSKPVINCCEE